MDPPNPRISHPRSLARELAVPSVGGSPGALWVGEFRMVRGFRTLAGGVQDFGPGAPYRVQGSAGISGLRFKCGLEVVQPTLGGIRLLSCHLVAQ